MSQSLSFNAKTVFDRATSSQYFPPGHGEHAVALTEGPYVPTGQGVGASVPSAQV